MAQVSFTEALEYNGSSGGGSSYNEIGDSAWNTYIRATLSGTLNNYTVLAGGSDASIPSSGRYIFTGSELTLKIEKIWTNTANPNNQNYDYVILNQIRILLGSSVVRTIDCRGGDLFGIKYDFVKMCTTLGSNTLTIPLNETKKHYGGNPYGITETISTGWAEQYSDGYKLIYVEIDYNVPYSSSEYTAKFQLGRVYFYPLNLSKITLNTSNVTKKFYKNSTFSSNGLVVTAWYYYNSIFGGNLGNTYDITSRASISKPTMTSAGTKSVTVSYNSKSTTYDIEVVGVASITENTATNYKYLVDTSNPGVPGSVKITYTDNTSRTVSGDDETLNFQWTSGNFDATGDRTFVFSIYDENTNETISTSVTKKVFDVSELNITTAPTKTTYQTNEDFDDDGMVVTATYGEAGDNVVANSDCTITPPDMSVVASSADVDVSFRNKSDTTQITIDGLTEVRIYVPDGIKKLLKGGDVSLEGLQIFYTCSDQAETELEQSSSKVSIDTSEINTSQNGVYNVYVTVTHEGNSITKSYEVTVYSLESLALSEYKAEFVKSGSTNPTFSVGSLSVEATFSDGTSRTLSNSEYTVSEPDNMDVGTHEVVVSSTIGTTISETYNIEVIEDYPIEIVEVDRTLWNDVFVAGDVFSKTNIIVYANMYSGVKRKQVDFSTSLDNNVFGTDITTATTNFTLSIETNDPENPLTVAYNSDLIKDSETLTVRYDKLNSLAVDAGNSTGALRWVKAGSKFTDYVNDSSHIVVTATYEYSGAKTIARGLYDICVLSGTTRVKEIDQTWTKDDMGDNTVTVSFGGQTATYVVRVSKLFSISVTTSRNPNTFIRNEDLDLTQLTIKKRYTHDGENAEIGEETISYSNVTFSGHKAMKPDNVDGLTHDVGLSYTEADVTATTTLSVTVKRLSSVTLDAAKISVNYGESLNLVGHFVSIAFNTDDESHSYVINSGNTIEIDGTTYSLALSLDSLIIKNKVENVTIGMTFGQETVYATFNVHCIYLHHISLDVTYYSGQTLYAGDVINLANISVSEHIYSTDSDDANYPQTNVLDNDDVSFNISDGHSLVAGSNSIEASYSIGTGNTLQSKSANATLTALEISLSSISADISNLTKALSDYVDGQNLNLDGLVVNAVFNRTQSNRTLNLTECKVYIDGEERYYTTPLAIADNNKTLVVAYTYNGTTKTATIGTLTVVARALASIAVKNTSTHDTSYLIGDKFSTDGLIITATYNDGYQEDITSGFTTSLDAYKSVAFASAQVGNVTSCTVYLTVGETTQSCSYSVTVGNPALTSLRLDTSLVVTTVTNGTAYSTSGLVVYGIFENGYEEQLTFTTPSITSELSIVDGVVSFASNDLGVKNVTISATNPYNNLQNAVTTQLAVTVTPNLQLVDIRLKYNEEQDPFNYRVGDTFDAKGVIVEALFKDTDWMEVSGWETSNPTLGTLLRSGGRLTVTVSFTSQGEVKTQDYIIVVAMPYDSGLVEENTYKVAFNVTQITHEEAVIDFSDDTQLPLFNANLIAVDDDETSDTYGLNIYTGADADDDCVGYLKLGSTSDIDNSVIENAITVLFDDPVNPIDGQGNIIVKYPHYVSGYADRINKCHFGIIYNKRLFVSGNPDYPNIDWHSSQVNSSQVENYNIEEDKDLTYFSDLDYCKYGSENSAIKGYDIYRDGTLLVFKEKAQHEATIYTRTTQLVNASSYDGTVVSEGELAEESYPCFEVNPNGGAGALSQYSIINFVGETLVLTRDGLKAITSKEVTYNNAKYSYDVSSHINNKLLKNNNLVFSIISQFKEKLLLKTDEGLYVGEYKLRDENSEYEWYFCDNIDAYYFFEIDNELYFSDNSGNISRFVENDESVERKDKPRTYVGLAGTTLSIDSNTDVIVVSSAYEDEIEEGKEFHLLNQISSITGDVTDESQIYASMGIFIDTNVRDNNLREGIASFDQTLYAGLIDSDNNEIIIKPYTSEGEIDYSRMNDIKQLFYGGRGIYFDSIVGTVYSLSADTRYILKKVESVDPFDYRFQILDIYGNVMSLTGMDSFRISFRVNELEVAYITDVEELDGGGKQFRVSIPVKADADEEETIYVPLDLIYYNGRTSGTYRGVITKHENVISYYVTKPFNLGHDLYMKTIYLWSIINDTSIASYMNVGYIASRSYADFKMAVKEVGGARQLEFSNEFNVGKIHFTNDKLPHIYTRSRLLPRVGYIRFMFSNDEGTRMVLSKLDIIYTYSLLTKGVK